MKYVYRIVNILLAIVILLSAFFVNFIRVSIETTDKLADVISSFTENETNAVAMEEEFSIKRAIDVYTGKDSLSTLLTISDGSFTWPEEFKPLNSRLIAFGVSFAVMILLALFLIIFSAISSKRLPTLIAGIVGIAADIVMMKSFQSAATLVYNNTVNLADYIVDKIIGNALFNSLVGSAASSYLSFVFALCGLQNALLFAFIAVVLWAVIFYVVDIGDPDAAKEKAEAKMAKEAKKANKGKKAKKKAH